MVLLNNFEYSEFDSSDSPGSGIHMDDDFLLKLDEARTIAGIPFIINSGYRTIAHNAYVGGKISSSHIKGCAVDLKANDSRSRGLILSALRSVGFSRIGIDNTFIHVDSDKDKNQDVTWLY